ncbi:MAG TPA: ATP-binding protein [Oligoflexia bacterium]|nr:ATP-binding protein [Oligoflexia bacterium]HMR24152.1 ATP-binding protein [Oligoflexia bacterium]
MNNQIQNNFEDSLKKIKVFCFARVIIAFTLCFFTFVFEPMSDDFVWSDEFTFTVVMTGANLFFAIGYFLVLRIFYEFNEYLFIFIQLTTDAIFTTLFVYLSGIELIYFLNIINASFLLFRLGAFFSASLSSIFYSLLVYALITKQIYPILPKVWQALMWNKTFAIQSVLIQVALFFGVAWFFTKIAYRFDSEEKRLKQNNLDLQKKAKRAQQLASIGEMTARIAHEIRNPLTSIFGTMQLLQKEHKNHPQYKKLIDITLKETDRLNFLLEELLDFAKPRSQVKVKFSLTELLENILKLLKKEKKGVFLRSNIEQNVFIVGNEQQLSQVIWNLIRNAQEATGSKGVIEINLQKERDNVILSIEDDGPGLSDDIKVKMFDPFFTTKTKGSGLGLAIVERFISDHQGYIVVESEKESGTQFKIYLPLGVEN